MIDIEYDEEVERPARAELMLEAKLGYRNKGDPKGEWKEYARSFESRNLDCNIDPDLSMEERAGTYYNCSMLVMIEGQDWNTFQLIFVLYMRLVLFLTSPLLSPASMSMMLPQTMRP